MSRQNVELVKRLQPTGVDLVEVFSAGADQLVGGDAAELFTDDFDVAVIVGSAGGQLRQSGGPEGLTAIWRDWLTPWRSYRLDVEEFIDAGDAIVVFARVQARTERDGVLVQHSPAAVWRIRKGKVAAIHFYLEREEALAAVGLGPSARGSPSRA
jgi:ketosteroid isomerase-like protein